MACYKPSMLTRNAISSFALVGAVLGGLFAATGCKKDEAKAKAGGGAAAPASSDLRRALAMIPVDTDGVVGLNLAQVRASALASGYQDRVLGAVGGELKAFEAVCGFDPMKKVNSAILGGKGERGNEDLVAVLRGLPRAELMACADKASKDPALTPGVTLTVDGAYVVVTAEGKSVALQFTDDTTLLAVRKGGAAASKADLAAIAAAADGQGVTGSSSFMQLIDEVDTDASVWFVVSGKSKRVQDAGRGMIKFEAALGSVTLTDTLVVVAAARLESPDAAKGMADSFGKTLDSMKKSLLKNVATDVTVKSDGSFVRLHAKMTKQQLEELVGFASAFIGNPFE